MPGIAGYGFSPASNDSSSTLLGDRWGGCCLIGVGGVTDPQYPNTYFSTPIGTSPYDFGDLSADAQPLIENRSETGSTTVEDIPAEFSSTGVTIVRYDGEKFCVRATDGSRQSTQAPEETSPADQTVTVQNCTGVALNFNSLSASSQALVSATLASPDNQITVSRELPQEFSATASGVGGFTPPERENPPGGGNYYIFKDNTVYQFTIRGGVALGNMLGGALTVVAGVVLMVVGVLGYTPGRVRIAALVGAPVSVGIVPAWLQFVGLYGWAVWLDQQPKHLIAIVLLVLTGLSVILYDRYQRDEKG